MKTDDLKLTPFMPEFEKILKEYPEETIAFAVLYDLIQYLEYAERETDINYNKLRGLLPNMLIETITIEENKKDGEDR